MSCQRKSLVNFWCLSLEWSMSVICVNARALRTDPCCHLQRANQMLENMLFQIKDMHELRSSNSPSEVPPQARAFAAPSTKPRESQIVIGLPNQSNSRVRTPSQQLGIQHHYQVARMHVVERGCGARYGCM
eukprot:2159627-Amphidinium_carterae.1